MHNKILQVLDLRDSPWVDGPGRTILQCADMVDKSICNIHIGAFYGESHNEHAYLNKAIQLGLDVIAIKEKSSFDKFVIKQINQIIDERAIDIVHTHDFRSNIYGLICSHIKKLPLISTCHGWISNNLRGKVYTEIDKYLLKFHDQIIVVSEIMKNSLVQTGIEESKIKVINNALKFDDYIIDREQYKLRSEYKISHDKKIIANIGRLSPEKKQNEFIKAAKTISLHHIDAVFLIIGVGPEESRLKELAEELGISDKVIFTGYRNDMARIYNEIDLVVQSSNTEGMPNVILESLLMTVPVIATNVGGTSQIVKHDISGTLIEPNNLDALIEAMESFFENEQLHQDMALAGRAHVINNFNQEVRLQKLIDVYQTFVKR